MRLIQKAGQGRASARSGGTATRPCPAGLQTAGYLLAPLPFRTPGVGSPQTTSHASGIAVVTSHSVRALHHPRTSIHRQRPPRPPGEVLKLPSTALNCQRAANQRVPGLGRAEAGEWRAAERGGERTGRRPPWLARQSASPPGSAPRPRQVSGGAAGSRRAGRAGGGDAHRLGLGAALSLRTLDSRSARRLLAARRPPPAVRRPWPAVFIQTRVAGEAEAAKTAAEPARIPGNVSAAPRPTRGSDRGLACARRARARGGRALPGKGGT